MSKYIGDVSAYAYAVSKGYAGTEEEFAELMADYAEVGQRAEDAADRAEAALDEFTSVTADATTLPEGSSATAEYSDGHLTLGIPKGDKGDGAYHVELSGESFVIHTDASGVAAAQEFMIYIDARQGTTKKVISRVEGLPSISTGSGTIAPEIIKHAFTGSVATIIYTIPANTQISAGQINAQYTAYINDGTANGFGVRCALSVAVVKDGAKGDKGDTGDKGDKGDKGDTGNTGNTPNLTIGTVTTLQPTAPATATITGTADNPVLSFGIPKGDTGEVSQDQFDAALALKADAIGNYPELAVGMAEQIDSDTVVAEDVAPYQFRQSISGASNRAYDEIVGGSLAVNQLVQNGNFVDTTVWTAQHASLAVSGGVATLTPSNDGSSALITQSMSIKDHVYFAAFSVNTPSSTGVVNFEMRDASGVRILCASSQTGQWERCKSVYKIASSNASGYFRIKTNAVQTEGQAFAVKDVVLFDLTAMFGTTIADYLYGLETATAGAGVEWLKSHFPKIFDSGYIPYNAGTLEHVSGLSAHKMTGFNQFDKDTMVKTGYIGDGGAVVDNSAYRCTDYIKVVGGAVYYIKTEQVNGAWGAWYDANKNYISDCNYYVNTPLQTAPQNACFIRLTILTSQGGNLDTFCINLHWDGERDGEYEAYEEHSYPLDSDVTLRGIPKLDANNNLYYDGDEYEADGTVTRRYGIVDLGTLTWTKDNNDGVFYVGLPTAKYRGGCSCDKYLWKNVSSWSQVGDGEFAVVNSVAIPIIFIKDLSKASSTASEFKSAMSGVMLVYELATPTTESAQPFTNPQVVDASGTEEYVTDSVVPVGHVTKYVENLKAKLESAPASPTEDGDYIVRQTDGVNEYVPLDSAPAITAKADVTDLLKAFPTDSAQGAIASFTDGAELPLKSLTVDIEPIQDLHGYDNPWPAGGGKNLLPSIDATFTDSGVTWTLNSDGSVKLDGTATANSVYDFGRNVLTLPAGTYITYDQTVSGLYSVTIFKIVDGTASAIKSGGGAFTLTEATSVFVRYVVSSGTTVNTTIYPQLEAGSTATAYAPYENICPISGWTGANVTRCGKNLLNVANISQYDVGLSSGDRYGVSVSRPGTFTVSSKLVGSSLCYIYAVVRNADSTFGAYEYIVAETVRYTKTLTVPDGGTLIVFNAAGSGSAETTSAFMAEYGIQIEVGSTATAYEAPQIQSITIALGQTVYGGTLDVLSGELVIDRAMVDLGSLQWANNATGINAFEAYCPFHVSPYTSKLTSNVLSYKSSFVDVAEYTIRAGNGFFAVKVPISVASSGADVKQWLTNNNAVLVYELSTPITVTLTPNELSTLLGANNIWSDAGEVTAEYRADPTLFIQRKIAEALS